MQSEELNLIDGLFSRLKAAQDNSGSRDASAEQRITQHLQSQPAAPYYMAQTILIQEAAVKQLHGQVQALEAEVARLRDESSRQQKAAAVSSPGYLAAAANQPTRHRVMRVGKITMPVHKTTMHLPRGTTRHPVTGRHLRRATGKVTTNPRLLRPALPAAALWLAHYRRQQVLRAVWCWEICSPGCSTNPGRKKS